MAIKIKGNTYRAIKYGFINKIISLILPFFIQAIMIRTLGIEYVGIKGLFTSLLSILNLMELGFGSAISSNMFKSIAEDDNDNLCALLNYYKKAYRFVGFIILIIGCILLPFLKYLIKGDCPSNLNVYILFLLYLLNAVISYWCFAYKASILNAYQRIDVISNVNSIVITIVSTIQILILLFIKNFYLYLIISIIGKIGNNLIISLYVDNKYPNIKCNGELCEKERNSIQKKVVGVFISKICYTTRYSFDTIFISMFYGLTQTAMYTNYFSIINILNGFTNVIMSSILAKIGNSIALYDKDKNLKDMMYIDNAYLVLGGWMTTCLICLYQPFMNMWVGQDYLLSTSTMMLFSIYFYVKKMTEIRGVYASALGLFWEDKNRNIIEAIVNLILNYLLVKKYAVFGVMLATLLTFSTFGFFGSINIIFKHYFKCSKKQYYQYHIKHLLILIVVTVATVIACRLVKFNSVSHILLYRALICILFTPLIYWLIIRKCKDYDNIKNWLIHNL